MHNKACQCDKDLQLTRCGFSAVVVECRDLSLVWRPDAMSLEATADLCFYAANVFFSHHLKVSLFRIVQLLVKSALDLCSIFTSRGRVQKASWRNCER